MNIYNRLYKKQQQLRLVDKGHSDTSMIREHGRMHIMEKFRFKFCFIELKNEKKND